MMGALFFFHAGGEAEVCLIYGQKQRLLGESSKVKQICLDLSCWLRVVFLSLGSDEERVNEDLLLSVRSK